MTGGGFIKLRKTWTLVSLEGLISERLRLVLLLTWMRPELNPVLSPTSSIELTEAAVFSSNSKTNICSSFICSKRHKTL